MFAIFDTIINDKTLELEFLRRENQKQTICQLTLLSIKNDFVYREFSQICICGVNYLTILYKVLSVFANVLLNDYVKQYNNMRIDKAAANKITITNMSNSKKRKLNTFI